MELLTHLKLKTFEIFHYSLWGTQKQHLHNYFRNPGAESTGWVRNPPLAVLYELNLYSLTKDVASDHFLSLFTLHIIFVELCNGSYLRHLEIFTFMLEFLYIVRRQIIVVRYYQHRFCGSISVLVVCWCNTDLEVRCFPDKVELKHVAGAREQKSVTNSDIVILNIGAGF